MKKKQVKAYQIGIRDRIKELRRIKASELRSNPLNWRTHPDAQKAALRGILNDVGYAGAVLAYEPDDGGGLMLIDGHLRCDIDPNAEVPVLILDVDDREAKLLLATYDPLSALADSNVESLSQLMSTALSDDIAVNAMLDSLKQYEGISGAQLTAPEAPKSVEQNVAHMDSIRRQRKKCNDGAVAKGDTEYYLVIVFSSREEKNVAIRQLGLPDDERYIASSQVNLRARRLMGRAATASFSDGKERRSASPDLSGGG